MIIIDGRLYVVISTCGKYLKEKNAKIQVNKTILINSRCCAICITNITNTDVKLREFKK